MWEVFVYMHLLYNWKNISQVRMERYSQANNTLHDQHQSPSCETSGGLFFLSQIAYLQNTVSLVLLFYGYFVYSQKAFILEVQLKL